MVGDYLWYVLKKGMNEKLSLSDGDTSFFLSSYFSPSLPCFVKYKHLKRGF